MAAMAEIAEGQSDPRLVQLTLFLANRLGALREAVRSMEQDAVQICGVSILDAADHAVVRMVVNRPESAVDALTRSDYRVVQTEVLGVGLPDDDGFGVRRVLAALLSAEINVSYAYGLLFPVDGHAVLVVRCEAMEMATRVLRNAGLPLVGQDRLSWEE